MFKSKVVRVFLFLTLLYTARDLQAGKPKTPIRHLIVIFQENRTFDHYFGTYPNAQNNPGEVPFKAAPYTPSVNGFSPALLTQNPNSIQPFRLAPSQANTCSPAHDYASLQLDCSTGLMDQFVQTNGKCSSTVMGYFDGNTVTALWNYAQYFALSDNCHSTVVGPSTVGAINLISGQTNGATPSSVPGFIEMGTIINDIDPAFDMCSGTPTASLSGINIGNLLNAASVSWGWFQGGFANCAAQHNGPDGAVADYEPHHNPFQYYQSTSNPQHLPPTSLAMVGYTDQANHLYDIDVFWQAADSGNIPSVSFFKAPAYQDGHAGNSTPLLEQTFLVATINKLQTYPQWKHMAIIILYDDSGGWYDHEVPPLINQSQLPEDTFANGPNPPAGGYQGRPGYGLRIPFLIISPWAKINYVDNTLIDQTSVMRFIENNWSLGTIGNFSYDSLAGSILSMFDFTKSRSRYLMLNPNTGAVVHKQRAQSE